MAKRKGFTNRVWRFQRSAHYGDVITAMTHDRQWVVHFPLDGVWGINFAGRLTFYAQADLMGPPGQHRLRIVREVSEEDWK